MHIGLVFDLYEVDVRQFLQDYPFTQTGTRHVLNSVIAGLGFLHGNGMVHCDLKPANIFMRGAMSTRGCFEKKVLTQRFVGEWDPVDPACQTLLEVQYQIPSSFEALGSIEKHGRAYFELCHGMYEHNLTSNVHVRSHFEIQQQVTSSHFEI